MFPNDSLWQNFINNILRLESLPSPPCILWHFSAVIRSLQRIIYLQICGNVILACFPILALFDQNLSLRPNLALLCGNGKIDQNNVPQFCKNRTWLKLYCSFWPVLLLHYLFIKWVWIRNKVATYQMEKSNINIK